MTDNFVNLHNHSDYSLLDGFGTVDEYIARAVELEQPALGLTDHGNVCGLYSFVNKCHKAGIKPIPGIEAYIAPVNPKGAKCHKPIRYGVAGQESIDVSGNGSYLHMTLFAMNKQGMKSLYALVREASEEGNAFSHLPLKEGEGNFYTKPRMDMDMLAAHNAGLIATTGCPSGEIQTRFRLGQDREAYDYATRMAELFDGRYFVEIMDHSMKGNDIERNVLPKLIKLADDLHLPLIATNDAHYCRAEDAPHHEEMLCSNSKAKMTDPTYEQGGNRFAFNGNQYYLKSSADMLTIPVFQEHPEAVENTVKLADMVEDINFELEGDLRPEVKIPDGYDEVSWFKHKIKEGFIKKRVQAGASKEVIRESQKRIAHELPVFTENNFAQYMLVVQDYINWAREHGILVGFGRGCFLPGAKIRAKQGGFTNIENIKIGDKVRTHDATYHTVENVFEYDVKDDDCVEILLSNGMTIKCTADHMLFGDEIGFKKAEDFKAGDIVLGPVGNKTDNNEINYELNTYNDSLHETNKSGYFHSYQNDKDIYYASSYELKALNILETDSTVKSFGRSDDRITYISPDDNNKHYYLPDLEVLYKDGTHSVIEVKAKWQLSEPATIAKINAAKKFYEEKGIKFNVWTEDELQAMNDAWHVKIKILSIKHFKYTGKVYDLQVEGVHNYTVSDITVHNSVGGSEIAYLMNISDTDPIRHNLMFERFLNPERISPPDVDTDFAASRRDEVVDYVKEKYGEDHIANIITFNRFLSKTALNDMARIYGIPIFEVNKADSLMPESKPGTSASFDDIFNEDGKFHSAAKDFIEYVDKPEWKPVIAAARAIEGRIKTTGVHACGLIMSSHPITDAAPFTYKHNPTKPWGSSCCQWTYEELESIGLIKMDFLSLSDLDLVADTIANIKHTHDGKAPDMWELVHGPMDDKPTYDMLSRGETMNVFQLSSEGMQALFKRMQPTCFEDIQASVALYRPGPMGMNAHTQYADRKAGREKDIVINPELDAVFRGSPVDDVLKPTHGLCVPADTMILDASTGKNVKIKDFIQGHMTKSWNEKTGLTSFNKVSHVIHTGYKDVVNITMSGNKEITVGNTHPLLTQRGWVQAKDLKITDLLASSIYEEKCNNYKTMPSDLAWFIGAMLGDGSITGKTPSFTTADDFIVDELRRIIPIYFTNIDVYVYPKAGNVYKIEFMNKDRKPTGKYDRSIIGTKNHSYERNEINIFLASVGYSGKIKYDSKYISDNIFEYSNDVLKNVIAGMWDTDGTCKSNGINYVTTSKKLYLTLRYALDRIGIKYSVSETKYHNKKKTDKTAYRIYPSEECFENSILPYLRLKGSNYVSHNRHANDKIISRFKDMIVSDFNRWVRTNDQNAIKAFKFVGRKNSYIGIKSMTNCMKKSKMINSNLGKIQALEAIVKQYPYILSQNTKNMLNLRWTNISHIENAGKMDCYDITVDNDHTFFINGFITHNCLYQEEVMNISRFLSGFTWGQADALRKGMGHKKIEVLNEMEPKFIEGAVKNGYPRKETKELWEYLKKFGEYGFNASHAASYGIIAYETAYLKCHYPAEFMAAVLTDKIRKAKSPDDVKNALREVRELGLKVAAIDIDASDVGVSAVKKEKPDDPDIVFGISGIKGVSPSFAEKFVKVRDAWHKEHGRNYASIDEFMRSLPSDLISKRLIEGLAVAGAFDKFGVSRRAVYTVMPEMLEYYKNDAKQKEAGKSSLFDLFDDDEDDDTANANTASTTVNTGFNIPDLPDWDWIHKLEMEEEKLGVFVSGHPLSNIGDGLRFIQIGYAALDDKYGTVITVDDVAKMNITSHDYNGRKYYDSLPVRIIASVADINVRTNKRGSKIIDGRLESERNSIPFRVSKDSMDDVLAKMGTIEAIMKNHVYIISGNITIDWNGNHMMAVDSFDEVMLDRDGRAPIWIHMLARHVRKKDSPGYMKLMRILNNPKNKGDIPVMIHVRNEDKSYGEIDTGCRVSCNDELIMSLEKLIGTNHFGRWSKNISKK